MGFFVFAVYSYIVNDMKTSDLNINSCSSGCSNGSKGTLAELQFGHHLALQYLSSLGVSLAKCTSHQLLVSLAYKLNGHDCS